MNFILESKLVTAAILTFVLGGYGAVKALDLNGDRPSKQEQEAHVIPSQNVSVPALSQTAELST